MSIKEKMLKFFKDNKDVIISTNKLAEKMGVVRGTVLWHLKNLIKEGRIKVEHRQSKETGYMENHYIFLSDNRSREYIGGKSGKRRYAIIENGKFLSKIDNKWYPLSERYGRANMTKAQARKIYVYRGKRK